MKFDFGFIGTGAMGGALAEAVAKNPNAYKIALSDKDASKAEILAGKIGATAVSVSEVACNAKYIYVGVKPHMLKGLFEEISNSLETNNDFVIVSMAAGTSISQIEEMIGKRIPIIRIMPNLPCSVGFGVTMASRNDLVSDETFEIFKNGLSMSGFVDEVDESMIDIGASVSGSGPAFAFMMIEALADGAVMCGFPRAKAYTYAAEMLIGSSKLFLETGKSPSELKDAVCSPKGTTIEGVKALEDGGFRASVIEAVVATYEKTKKIQKGN